MPSHNAIAGNKLRRQGLNIENKKTSGKEKREERMRRRKAETKDPELKRERLARNQTRTLDQKRVWDDGDEDSLYTSVDVAAVKRRKLEEEEQAAIAGAMDDGAQDDDDGDDDDDSMLGSDEDEDEDEDAVNARIDKMRAKRSQRQPSLAPSTTSTNFDMTPAVLSIKFPSLFNDEPPRVPKVLITTSINSTLHKEAGILMSLFPNSEYIRRSAHRYGHKYSVREICKFATNRDYTTVLVLNEDQKKPNRLTVVHLPSGPTLTYSVNNWVEGSKLPGHGNAQDEFYPELLLNNFKSSLGLLSAKSFQTLFPPQPDIEARQVVTLHNQRDYIFLRRHRYVFREKRATEKSVQSAEGTELKGVEGIRAGLQELGPRCTLKLRRVDKGIGRAGSEGEDPLSWEWQAGMEKVRTRFNL
ncbi:unnamed protein product [Discula destructiva]